MSYKDTIEYQTRFDQNYDNLRYEFVRDLMDHGYAKHTAENCNDWRDEFVESMRQNQ